MPFISNHKKAVNLLLSIAVLNSTSHERSLSKTDLHQVRWKYFPVITQQPPNSTLSRDVTWYSPFNDLFAVS